MHKKFVFYLLGKKGLAVLTSIVNQVGKHVIDYVVVGRDKNVIDDYAEEILEFCNLNNIVYYKRSDNFYKNNNYVFAIGWRWLICDCENLIVLHDSLLPRYRGFGPLVSSLINGENILGVTALFASNDYDRGDIICQSKIEIDYPIKIADAIDKVSECYVNCIKKIIDDFMQFGIISGSPQNEKNATYSPWRDSEDYFMDWSRDSKYIKRFVDAVGFPYDSARTEVEGQLFFITDVEICEDVYIEDRKSHIGKVIFYDEGFPVVICGGGLIKITGMLNEEKQSALPLKKFRVRFA